MTYAFLNIGDKSIANSSIHLEKEFLTNINNRNSKKFKLY